MTVHFFHLQSAPADGSEHVLSVHLYGRIGLLGASIVHPLRVRKVDRLLHTVDIL